MSPLELSSGVCEAMFAEASAVFPREACGVVVGPRGVPGQQRFVRFDNLQDELHQRDPERYPRDARTAFSMNALKLSRLISEVEGAGGALIAVVHSHPQHPSYFSDTDQRNAMAWGQPIYPDAVQLVVSVFDGEVRDLKGFVWSGEAWVEHTLVGVPPLAGPPPGAVIYGDI